MGSEDATVDSVIFYTTAHEEVPEGFAYYFMSPVAFILCHFAIYFSSFKADELSSD